MASWTAWFFPSTARIQSQGKITFTARSVTRVPPIKGWAFLNRAERNVHCQDQNSSGQTCKISSKDLASSLSGRSREHHFSRFAGGSPSGDQREANARRRGW